MKRTILLIFVPLISFFSLLAQVTQKEADEIILQRLESDTKSWSVYAKEIVQSEGVTVVTTNGEVLELDYPVWFYYVSYIGETGNRYLIVKENNGNLLEVNTKNDTEPNDLTEWRAVVFEISFEEYSLEGTSCQWSNLDYNNTIVIVNSQEELQQYVNCNEVDYPEIDFSKHTLILASGWAPNGIVGINTLFSKESINKYILTVIIHLNDAGVMTPWHVSILVQKIDSEATVTLKRIYE